MSNTMLRIEEGGLRFDFTQPDNAELDVAVKYDDWSFYRNQFNAPFKAKAVDIIYLNDNVTWLIEVKDYREHRRVKTIDLIDEIALKVRDTLAGLVAAKNNAADPDEKRFAKEALTNSRIRVVLHIESPQMASRLYPRSRFQANLLQSLKKKVKAVDAHPKVVNKDDQMPWRVVSM